MRRRRGRGCVSCSEHASLQGSGAGSKMDSIESTHMCGAEIPPSSLYEILWRRSPIFL